MRNVFADMDGRHVGCQDPRAGLQGIEINFGVKFPNEIGVAHAFLRNHFEDRVVGHSWPRATLFPSAGRRVDTRKVRFAQLNPSKDGIGDQQ